MKSNIRIMLEQQSITDGEVERFMDFDTLLEKHQQLQGKKIKLWKIIVPIVLILGIGTYFIVGNKKNQSDNNHVTTDSITRVMPPVKEPTNIKMDTVSVVKEEQVSIPKEETQLLKKNNRIVPQVYAEPIVIDSSSGGTVSNEKNSEAVPEIQKTESVYIQAEPIDGYTSLYKYFGRELIYPQEAVKDSIEGVLTVTFLINKSGKPERIKTSGSLGRAFEREAIRLVENMPLWKPATFNGQPMISKLSLPLTFQLRNKK